MNIKYEDFASLQHNELTSHSSNWIKSNFYVDGKPVDINTILPLGAVHHLGKYYVDYFELNDSMKTFTIYLKKQAGIL